MTRSPLHFVLVLLVALAVALGGAGCGKSSSSSNSQGAPAATATTGTIHLAKTKFALHAGLAFGAFHRYIYKPYKEGNSQADSFTTSSRR